MISLEVVNMILARPKSLVKDMVWSSRHGKIAFHWLTARMPVQFDDEEEIREQFFVSCQWRKKGSKIPEHWTFNLIYNDSRIYALHFQPSSIHENEVGKGRPYFGKEIDGIHEHTWSQEGDGYAEPVELPPDRPDVMWRMFLKRANINGGEFFHPDDNQPELI